MDGGGILKMWNNKTFNCVNTEEGKGYIVIRGDYRLDQGGRLIHVEIINVFSSCAINDKRDLWKQIGHIKSSNDSIARCVVGDFNSVRHSSGRRGIGHTRVNSS